MKKSEAANLVFQWNLCWMNSVKHKFFNVSIVQGATSFLKRGIIYPQILFTKNISNASNVVLSLSKLHIIFTRSYILKISITFLKLSNLFKPHIIFIRFCNIYSNLVLQGGPLILGEFRVSSNCILGKSNQIRQKRNCIQQNFKLLRMTDTKFWNKNNTTSTNILY